MKKGDDDIEEIMQIITCPHYNSQLWCEQKLNGLKAFSVQDAGSKYNSDKGMPC